MSLDDPISEFVQEGRKKKERASVDFRKDSGDSGFLKDTFDFQEGDPSTGSGNA